MKKRDDKKLCLESQLYNEDEFYREKEFYRKSLKFVLKNLNENCVERRKIEKGLEEIRREFFR